MRAERSLRLLSPLFLLLPGVAFGAPPEGMLLIPAGELTMGADDGGADEAPAHRVMVRAYYLDRTEVTVAAFAEFVRRAEAFEVIEGPWFRYSAEGASDLLAALERRRPEPPAQPTPKDLARRRAAAAALTVMTATLSLEAVKRMQASLPVRGVSWRDAARFARWAGKRLPTEAEWERAARGSDARRYPWGSVWDPTRSRSGLPAAAGPAPVGSFPEGASPFGVLDLAGNVWEWVADWYGEDAYRHGASVDPTGPIGLPDGQLPALGSRPAILGTASQGREGDTRKVVRGGCWAAGALGQAPFNARSSRRLWANPGYGQPDVGFRCAKDLP